MAKQVENRTDAHRLKLIVSAGLAAASTLLFLALIFEDIGDLADSDWSNLPIGMIVRYIVAMGLGGAIAGYALSNLFGQPGLLGWALSLIGGVSHPIVIDDYHQHWPRLVEPKTGQLNDRH